MRLEGWAKFLVFLSCFPRLWEKKLQTASQMLIGKEQWIWSSALKTFLKAVPTRRKPFPFPILTSWSWWAVLACLKSTWTGFLRGGQQSLPFLSALLRDWLCNAQGKQTCLAPFCCWLGEAMGTLRYSQNPELPWPGLHSRWFYLCGEDPWGPSFGPPASALGVCSILLGVCGQFIFKFFRDIDSSKWNRQQIALDKTCLSFQLTLI